MSWNHNKVSWCINENDHDNFEQNEDRVNVFSKRMDFNSKIKKLAQQSSFPKVWKILLSEGYKQNWRFLVSALFRLEVRDSRAKRTWVPYFRPDKLVFAIFFEHTILLLKTKYLIILLSEYQNTLSLHLHWLKFSTTPSIFRIHKNSNLKDFWRQIRILENSNSNLTKPWFLLELVKEIVSAKIWPKWSFSCFFHRCFINSILNLQM